MHAFAAAVAQPLHGRGGEVDCGADRRDVPTSGDVG